MSEQQPWMCEHANEVPAQCKCYKDCYCKDNTCKKDRKRAVEFNLIDSLQNKIKELEAEIEEYSNLTQRQSNILTKVVNAIKGKPPELVWWSHHDAGEIAENFVKEIKDLQEDRDYWQDMYNNEL